MADYEMFESVVEQKKVEEPKPEEEESAESDAAPETYEDAPEDAADETEDVEGFGNFGVTFSLMEFVKRLLKYLVEGVVVAIAASTIPKKALDLQEVGVIALSAAATFALLDLFAPTISYAARQGAGFGMGANLVGFPKFA